VTYRDGDKLSTKIFHKPTDNKLYLHYNSAHPKKQKESVPYGLLIRARRICTKIADFEQEATSILNKLKKRKYPDSLLEECYTKVKSMDRNTLLVYKTRPEKDNIRFITNYNPNNPDPNTLIRKHAHVLQNTRKKNIKIEELQVTYSRSKNLRDLLVSGQLTRTKQSPGTEPCNKTRCKTCTKITTDDKIQMDNDTIPVRGSFTCQSPNVVYLMTCKICKIKYVGETSNTLNQRCRGHESAIRLSQAHPVAQHYNLPQHTEHTYNIMALDRERDKNKRLRLEEAWMYILNTLNPSGLNIRY
jgi:hypothetical protein